MIGAISSGMNLVKVLAIIAAVVWLGNLVYNAGADSMDKKWREKQVEAKEDRIHSINTLKESLRSLSLDMADKVDELNQKNLEDKKYAQLAKDTLIDNIMSGKLRVRVATKAGSGSGANCNGGTGESNNTEAKSEAVAETTSELHPTVAANLFRITSDADELANDYNDLVDYTTIVIDSCGAKKEPE